LRCPVLSALFVERVAKKGLTMKRILAPFAVALALLFALCCSALACAQQLSDADLAKALELLESSKKDVLDATKGLSRPS
jgi:hypothetical protein